MPFGCSRLASPWSRACFPTPLVRLAGEAGSGPAFVKQALGNWADIFFDTDRKSFSDSELIGKRWPWVGDELEVTRPGRVPPEEPYCCCRAGQAREAHLLQICGRLRAICAGQFGRTPTVFRNRRLIPHFQRFNAGRFEIQDLSFPGRRRVCRSSSSGRFWWGCLPGKGAKNPHLSELMENKMLSGLPIEAAWRLQRLKRRAGREPGCLIIELRSLEREWRNSPTKTKFRCEFSSMRMPELETWQRNPPAVGHHTEDLDAIKYVSKQSCLTLRWKCKPEAALLLF